MADRFVAEIRILGFNFAPSGWAQCNGQLLPLSQNTALFSLLGTTYGGNGQSNFALPDLQGSAVVGAGQGQGLSERFPGETSGVESVTLLESEMPVHTHTLRANSDFATLQVGGPDRSFARSQNGNAYGPANANPTPMSLQMLAPAGGDLPHNNMMPYLVLNFCIALQGEFPSRA